MIGRAEIINNLYVLKQDPSKIDCKHYVSLAAKCPDVNSLNKSDFFYTWHFRLGHPSITVLQHVSNVFPYVTFNKNLICDSCHYAKQTKLRFAHNNHIAMHCFDLLHMDIWGPIGIPSMQGHHYFLTIVDDHSRFTWLFLMKNKGETRDCIKNFITYIQTQFSAKIKSIRSDNGPEFNMSSYLASLGIIHQRSCVETPQQNSIVER